MLPRSTRDTGALELGFLADRVLQALKAVRAKRAAPSHLDTLEQASRLMQELSRNVGPARPGDTCLTLNAVQSFTYAAEALSAVSAERMRDGLRELFAKLAETLRTLARDEELDPENVEAVEEFFRRLSDTTFQHWSLLGDDQPLRRPELA